MPARNAPYVISPETIPLMPQGDQLRYLAQQQLQQQATPTVEAPDRVRAASPDHQMYGIFAPAYAQALATRTGAAGGDLLRLAALGARADAEPARYDAALQRAQAGAEALGDQQGYYGVLNSLINKEPTPVLSGTRTIGRGADGHYGILPNAPVAALDNQIRGDNVLADTFKTNMEGVGAGYNAGVRFSPETVGELAAGAGSTEPVPVENFTENGLNPGDQFNRDRLPIMQTEAEAAMVAANASQYRAEHPSSNQGYVQEQYLPGAPEPITTVRTPGAPAQGSGGGGGAVPTPSPAQQRMIEVTRRSGGQAQLTANGVLVVVGPQGQRYFFDASGNRIQQARGDGSPASSPQYTAGPVSAMNRHMFVRDRIGASRDGGRRRHLGYDMFDRAGAGLRVPHDVIVSRPRRGGISGNRVLLTDPATGAQWSPMHLPNFPRLGRYQAGELVLHGGLSGTSGRGTPHIHMQPMNNIARQMNPEQYFGLR